MRIPERLVSLVDYGIIEEVVRPLMSGKEALVYLVMSGGEERVAKVYKEADARTFKHRAAYTEGRKVRNSRDQRAMQSRSRHGRSQDEAAWRSSEVQVIYRLRDAGVRVPVPHHFIDGVLLMELIKDEDGSPAPRLGELVFEPEQARAIFNRLIAEVVRMLCAGIVHGDLSDFNVLMGADGPVVIDFPQAVDASSNQNARTLLVRDVDNLHRFLSRFVPDYIPLAYAQEMWGLYERSQLTPDTQLTGRHRASEKRADTRAVLSLISDAAYDERKRREGLGLSMRGASNADEPAAARAPGRTAGATPGAARTQARPSGGGTARESEPRSREPERSTPRQNAGGAARSHTLSSDASREPERTTAAPSRGDAPRRDIAGDPRRAYGTREPERSAPRQRSADAVRSDRARDPRAPYGAREPERSAPRQPSADAVRSDRARDPVRASGTREPERTAPRQSNPDAPSRAERNAFGSREPERTSARRSVDDAPRHPVQDAPRRPAQDAPRRPERESPIRGERSAFGSREPERPPLRQHGDDAARRGQSNASSAREPERTASRRILDDAARGAPGDDHGRRDARPVHASSRDERGGSTQQRSTPRPAENRTDPAVPRRSVEGASAASTPLDGPSKRRRRRQRRDGGP